MDNRTTQRLYDLSGSWQAQIGDGQTYPMQIPGTLDENGIGSEDLGNNQWHPDADLGNEQLEQEASEEKKPILTRFTRKHTFQGEAAISREVTYEEQPGRRLFLEVERARVLTLLVDGREVPDYVPPTLITPHIYEVTGLLQGTHTLTLLSDNSYPGLPAQDIIYSSAATDETQTNWNGLLGYVRLREEPDTYLRTLRIYPKDGSLHLWVEIDSLTEQEMGIQLCSTAILSTEQTSGEGIYRQILQLHTGRREYALQPIPMAENLPIWEEEEGKLIQITATLDNDSSVTDTFGCRTIGYNEKGQLTLNDRAIFLRGEANCAVFPETGYGPMTQEEWETILARYASYGVNCMRFHSHCPSKAAFAAADKLGMLMQPELSHWNPRDAFESLESASYYETELVETIKYLSNHPSFVMLTFGNELHCGEQGRQVMDHLLEVAHELDATRLYANGSNPFYGKKGYDANSDVYTSSDYYDEMIRGTSAAWDEKGINGHINRQYPNASTDYSAVVKKIHDEYCKPVYQFEVGQFEVLPDFAELDAFRGITKPDNIQYVKDRVEALGLLEQWPKYVEATGELSRIGYREEMEAALRTEGLSGISLLGLQDFPGQGTALVGMLDSHLQPKPYDFAQPERFREFFRAQLPLVLLPKYTYENTETLTATVKVANYGKSDLSGRIHYVLREKLNTKNKIGNSAENTAENAAEKEPILNAADKGQILAKGELPAATCPVGAVTAAGEIRIPFADLAQDVISQPVAMELQVLFCTEETQTETIVNTYPLWIYPPVQPQCPASIYETEYPDERAREILEQGGTVYLTPSATKEAMPHSIKTQFTTDFWSVGTFPAQGGGMGQLIDSEHPVFQNFPTESHTNWQWWPMAVSRALVLPRPYHAIVTEMDSYAYLRPMAQLLEVRCLKGRLLISSMGLQKLQQYPEARALLQSIYTYLDSEKCKPDQEMSWEELTSLF